MNTTSTEEVVIAVRAASAAVREDVHKLMLVEGSVVSHRILHTAARFPSAKKRLKLSTEKLDLNSEMYGRRYSTGLEGVSW